MLTYIESWGCRDPFGSPVTILFLEVITLHVVMTLLLLLQLINREMSKKKYIGHIFTVAVSSVTIDYYESFFLLQSQFAMASLP